MSLGLFGFPFLCSFVNLILFISVFKSVLGDKEQHMAIGNNNDNEDLNGAVEQVVTEDSSSSSNSPTGNQNNQQSTMANTVATGTDAVAPLIADDESQQNDEDDSSGSPIAENSEESNTEVGNDDESNEANDDTGSNVVDGELGEDESTDSNAPAAPSSSDTQNVGGESSDSEPASPNAQNSDSPAPNGRSSSVSSGAEGTSSEGGVFRDESIDTHTFGVNVEPERSVYSNELENSDVTTDTMTFAVNVSPVNDTPTAVDKLFTMQEDGVITFTAEELLAGSADIDSETLHIDTVTYTGINGVLSENMDGSFSFAPNENFNGHVDLSFTVSDSEATVEANIGLTIEGVNDIPVAGSTSYQVDEDHVLTFNNQQLLANSSDVEGDVAVQSVVYSGFEGELVDHEDGTYSFTPNENYFGELDFDVVIIDEEGATASTTANIQIVSINDPVIAVDDSELGASEPLIRLDSAPEHGTLEYLNDEFEWVEMVVGEEYSADTEVQFVSDALEVQSATCDIEVGSFDNNTETTIFDGTARTSDWGEVSGNTAVFTKEGVTITTETTNGDLFAWNGAGTAMGAGIGDTSDNGLSNDDKLIVTIEGEDVNQITFQLDGLGSWFDESDSHATEVMITAYDAEGNVIDSQGDYRESGDFQDEYSFTTNQPVHHFELGTSGGGGTYVVQNMTVSRTLSEELQLVTIQPDGSETNSELTLDLNYNTAGQPIDVTEELINVDGSITSTPIQVLEDGQLILNVSDLLANDTDADGDPLTIVDVHTTDNSHGEVTLTEDGQILYTPDPNYSGEADFHYVVTDGNGSFDSATVTVDVIPQQDAPITTGNLELTIDEDGSITLTQEELLANAVDVDGDDLTASNLSVGENAVIVENEDGSFTITPDEDFNGQLDIRFDVSDGIDVVAAGIDLTVDAVNDLTVVSGDVSASTDEDHSITITQAQLLANAADIDGDALSALDLIAENAEIVSHDDGSFTITPHQDFNGMINVNYGIHDGTDTVASNLQLTVDPVNDAPVISADVQIIIEEDGSYTVTQEELLQFATDVDNDDLTANIGNQGSETTATGVVVNAENGEPIAGVEVELSDEYGNSASTLTDVDGSYFVTGLIAGEGTVTIEEEDCITSCFTINEGDTLSSGTVAISEVMDVTDMRIVVTWGDSSETRDLDNHLWLYNTETGAELDHIYYQDMSHQLGDGTVQQDVDDTNSYGPETISVPNYSDANMHYSVHNYTARSWDVEGVDDVKVDVFVGDTLVTSFVPDLPTDATGDHWHVFDVVDGIIVPAQFTGSEDQFTVPTSTEVIGNLDAIEISDVVDGSEHESENTNTEGAGNSEQGEGSSGNGEASIADISMPNGVITDNGDGTYTITPDENFNGEFSINYSVDDGNGAVVPAQVDVSVTAVNDLAIVQDHEFTLNEDGVLIITDEELLAGSSDVDNDELSVDSVSYTGDDGTLVSNDDGTHTFTPNEDFNGSVNLEFFVTDGTESVAAAIDITVNAVNDAPTFTEANFVVNEDGSILITASELLQNASDIDGDTLSISGISVPEDQGMVVQDENGDWLYTPNPDASGEVALTVSVSDGTVAVDFASTISITPDADAPTLTLSLGNASITDFPAEDDGNVNDILAQWSTDNASGLIETNQESVYTGGDDGRGRVIELEAHPGDESNIYQDLDLQAGETISLTFDYSAREGYVGEGSQIDVYFDGQLIDSITQPTVGWSTYNYELTATTDNPRLEFDAPGSDSLGGVLDKIQIVEVPVEDQNIGIDISAALTDIDGSESMQSVLVENIPEGAMLSDGVNTFTATADENSVDVNEWAQNDVQFLPAENFSGEVNLQVSATSVENSNGDTETTTSPLTFTVEAVADAPELVITDGDGQVIEEGDEIRDDANIIELNLGAELVDQDLSETLSVTVGGAPEGSVIHYDGSTIINDQTNGLTSYADTNITVTFEGEDAGFQNSAGYYIVEEDGSISGVELIYDNASQQGSGGNLIPGSSSFSFGIEEGQSFNLFVVPNGFNHNNFNSMQNGQFVFRDEDGSQSTMSSVDPQLIFINEDGIETLVRSQNGDTVYHGGNSTNLNQDGVEHTRTTMNEQGELVYGIEDLYGGGDRDYDDFTFTIDLGEVNQSIYSGEIPVIGDDPIVIPTVILDQVLTLELPEGFNDEFDLIIEATSTEESNQDSATTTQTIHIDAIEYAPEVTPISAIIDEDSSITLTQDELLANATDINGDDLIATNLVVTNGGATVVLNEDGSYTITPDENVNGALEVSFDVNDGLHTVATELQLAVTPINDAPIAPTIVVSESEDDVLLIDPNFILSQASDIDNVDLILESISIRSPAQASLTQNQEGLYQVVVPEHFNGPIDIAYVVSDGELSTEGTVNVNIIPVDDAPFQSGNAHVATDEDGAITFNSADLIDLFGDVDSALTVSRVITAEGEEAEGTVIDNEDGTWTFTPTDDFAGTTGLQVVVTDGSTEVSMDMNVYIRPVADGVAITTSFDGPLVFPEDSMGHFGLNIEQLDTSEIMTSVVMTGYPIGFVVSDGEHTVTITEEGQGVDIGDWNLDSMTMVPPADFNGNFFVTVSVVSLDEVEDPADNPITQELGSNHSDESPFELDDDGYALLLSADLLNSLDNNNAENVISDVTYSGDNGTLIDNDNGTWSFWTNPDYDGEVNVNFSTSDGVSHQIILTQDSVDSDSAPITQTNVAEPQGAQTEPETEADYTVAPGDTLNIDIPTEISENADVDHIHIIGLPDGVEPTQGLSDGEGNYVISDTSQPITLSIDESVSGDVRVEMIGMTAMDDPIDGAVGFSLIDVDSSYEMQGSSADNADALVQGGDDSSGQDWTTADNTDVGVDVMDDSSSFDSATQETTADDDLSMLNDN